MGAASMVTLCVRVWIEIKTYRQSAYHHEVTLCVRVWIEISCFQAAPKIQPSHPLREGVD